MKNTGSITISISRTVYHFCTPKLLVGRVRPSKFDWFCCIHRHTHAHLKTAHKTPTISPVQFAAFSKPRSMFLFAVQIHAGMKRLAKCSNSSLCFSFLGFGWDAGWSRQTFPPRCGKSLPIRFDWQSTKSICRLQPTRHCSERGMEIYEKRHTSQNSSHLLCYYSLDADEALHEIQYLVTIWITLSKKKDEALTSF